jgi:hypothetical protein
MNIFICRFSFHKPAYTEVPLTRFARLALCELGQGLPPPTPLLPPGNADHAAGRHYPVAMNGGNDGSNTRC